MFYVPNVFDPWLIVFQIVALQCSFYVGLGFILALCDYVVQAPLGLSQMFTSQALNLETMMGWGTVAAFWINSLLASFGLLVVVGRARKCLDFGATLYIVHLLCCWCYAGTVPSRMLWWLLQLLCLITTVLVGEYVCMRRELQDIPVGSDGTLFVGMASQFLGYINPRPNSAAAARTL